MAQKRALGKCEGAAPQSIHFIKIHEGVGVTFWLNSSEFERVGSKGVFERVGWGVNPQIPDPLPIRVEFVFF